MFFKTHCFYFSTVTGDINRPLELDGTCIKRTAVSFISSMHLVASVAVRTGIPVSWCSLSSYHPQTPSNSNRLVSAFWHRIRYFPKDQTVTFSSKRKWGERNNNNKTNWSLLRLAALWNNLGKKTDFPVPGLTSDVSSYLNLFNVQVLERRGICKPAHLCPTARDLFAPYITSV